MAFLSSPMQLHSLRRFPSSLQPIAHKPLRLTRRSSTAQIRSAFHMDFPYLLPAHRDLMSDLLSSLDSHLPLLPPSSPLLFQNSSASSKGSLRISPGSPSSSVDFILLSWIHCELPLGVLNITTLSAFLKSTATDAPHLIMDFIQSGPKNMVVLLDLLPRKDLALHPDYLAHFYEETPLEKMRHQLDNCPQVKPYWSPSLYVRSALSPTAVVVSVVCEEEGQLEEVVGVHVGGTARGMARVWLERCVGEEREVGEREVGMLRRRDDLIKKKAIEVELTANLPRLFGEEVARVVVEAIQKAYGVS